jgi:Amidohydrolase family
MLTATGAPSLLCRFQRRSNRPADLNTLGWRMALVGLPVVIFGFALGLCVRRPWSTMPAELKAVAVAGLEKRRKFVGMCNRAGLKILAGTDGPGIGRLTAGFGLHHELALLVKAGLKPIEALQAATINAARALRKENGMGSLEPGKFADIVILNSDPLSDIHNTTKIDAVLLRGRMFDRTAFRCHAR